MKGTEGGKGGRERDAESSMPQLISHWPDANTLQFVHAHTNTHTAVTTPVASALYSSSLAPTNEMFVT